MGTCVEYGLDYFRKAPYAWDTLTPHPDSLIQAGPLPQDSRVPPHTRLPPGSPDTLRNRRPRPANRHRPRRREVVLARGRPSCSPPR